MADLPFRITVDTVKAITGVDKATAAFNKMNKGISQGFDAVSSSVDRMTGAVGGVNKKLENMRLVAHNANDSLKFIDSNIAQIKRTVDAGGEALQSITKVFSSVTGAVSGATKASGAFLTRFGKAIPKALLTVSKLATGVGTALFIAQIAVKQLRKSLDLVIKAFRATVAAIGLAVGAVIGFYTHVIKSIKPISEFNRNLLFMAQGTGLTTRHLSTWNVILQRSGGKLSDLTNASAAFQETIREVAGDVNHKLRPAFQKYGLDIDKIQKLDPIAQVVQLTKAISRETNAQERHSLAAQLVNDSYADQLPLLGRVIDSYDAQASKAATLGLVVTEASARASARALEAWEDFLNNFRGAVNESVANITPSITGLLEKLAEFKPIKVGLDFLVRGTEAISGAFDLVGNLVARIGKTGVADTLLWAIAALSLIHI